MKTRFSPFSPCVRPLAVVTLFASGWMPAHAGTYGWSFAGNGSWSLDTNWTGTPPAGGPDAAGDIVTISGGRAITLFDTGDAGDAQKTIGSLTFSSGTNSITAGTGTGLLNFDNGSSNAVLLQTSGSNSISAGITVGSGKILDITNSNGLGQTNRFYMYGKISGDGAITIAGPGQVVLANASNDFTGGVTLNSGTLGAGGSSGSMLGTGTLTINGGTVYSSASGVGVLTANNAMIWNGNFAVNGAYSLDMGNGAVSLTGNRTINFGNTGLFTVGGVISDGINSYSLTFTGHTGGRMTLRGANTYSGGTMIDAGLLATTSTGKFGTGDVTVAFNAKLTAGNNASFGDLATLTFASTSTAASINLNFTGADTLAGVYDSIDMTYLADGTYTAAQLNTEFGTTVFTGTGSLTIAAIPEPSTFAMIIGTLVIAVAAVRRKRHSGA